MEKGSGFRLALVALLVAPSILLVAVPSPVAAGPEPPSPHATAYNTQRKVVRSPEGTLYAAIAVEAGGVPQVRVLASQDGTAWESLPAPSPTGNASDRTSLAIDSVGRLHLVWTETTSSDRQVFYSRFEGGRWVALEQLSHSVGYAGFPSLAVDAEDRVQVVWYAFDGTFYQIYHRRLDASGWTPEVALTMETVDATSPAVALSPDGKVHVAWFRLESRGTFNEVAYLRLEGDTVAETGAISEHRVDSIDPSIVVDRGGTVHVVWSALVAGVERIQHVEKADNWSAIETISPPNLGARHPTLALDLASRLHIVWEGADGQIYTQVRNGSWSAPLGLSSVGVNRYPSARWSQEHNPLCGPNARLDVVWTQDIAGAPRLAYGGIDVPSPCATAPGGLGLEPWAIGAIALVVGAAAASIILKFRSQTRPRPPTGRSGSA